MKIGDMVQNINTIGESTLFGVILNINNTNIRVKLKGSRSTCWFKMSRLKLVDTITWR